MECSWARDVLTQSDMGKNVKRCNKKYSKISERLATLTENFSNGTRSRSSFLKGVAMNLSELPFTNAEGSSMFSAQSSFPEFPPLPISSLDSLAIASEQGPDTNTCTYLLFSLPDSLWQKESCILLHLPLVSNVLPERSFTKTFLSVQPPKVIEQIIADGNCFF